MKVCASCKESRPLTAFTRNASKKDGLNHSCKVCHRQYTRNHYEKRKGYYVTKAKRHNDQVAEEVRLVKSRPCADCKGSYPYYVMDFDHVRGEKLFDISSKAQKGISRRVLLEEIQKCDVVCANCHRARTHARQNSPL